MNFSIIFHKSSTHNFSEYGIQIPLLENRVLKTVAELSILPLEFDPVTEEDLAIAHTEEFLNELKLSPYSFVEKTYELVNSDGSPNRFNPGENSKPITELIEKAKIHVQGTYLAARDAMKFGFSYHLGGGMHHAMSFSPGGFCMFNDIIITLRKLQAEKIISSGIVIDLDCHKGDGTAELTVSDDSIITYSIHMANGWPISQDDNGASDIPSSLDIAVENSENYQGLLEESLERFLSEIEDEKLELAIVVHGVDVWEKDSLPSSKGISLSKPQVLERDLYVFNLLKSRGIPQAWCLGGGYGVGVSELYCQFLRSVAK